MQKIWIVLANASKALIYTLTEDQKLKVVEQINHPESRQKISDLVSDTPGAYQASFSGTRGSYIPHSDPKEVAENHFAQNLAEKLQKGESEHNYEQLIIFAPPEFQGLLRKHYSKQVRDRIKQEITKDYLNLSLPELEKLIVYTART